MDPFIRQPRLRVRGQSFIEEVVPEVARVRAELDRRGLGAGLEVDGGIDERTAPRPFPKGE